MSQDKQDSGVRRTKSTAPSIASRSSVLTEILPLGGLLLILAALALMPVGEGAFNIVVAVMGVLGLIALVRTPKLLDDHQFRLVLALVACLWIPMVISLIGAVEPSRATRTILAFLRFPAAAIFVILVLRHSSCRQWLPVGVFAIAVAWSVDGIIQWQFGRNVLGFPYDEANLTGMFHPKRVIGLVLAVLMPVVLETAWNAGRHRRAAGAVCWVLLATMPLVILLSGSRTSWMMLAVGVGCWVLYRYVRSEWRYKPVALVAVIAALMVGTLFVTRLPGMETRVEQTSKLFQGDYDSLYEATSGRLPVWEIAIDISRDYWLTGVGPRGYRFLYPDYAEDDTPWISPDGETGASHPHQTVLEVLTETGIIGLAGFALFWLLLIRTMWRHGNAAAWPWALAVLLAFFPLNTHMAIYSTYWSHISWWLVMIMAGMLSTTVKRSE